MAKIAILGFGTVGSGVYEVLCRNAAGVSRRAGEPVEVKYILDPKDFSGHPAADLFIKNFDTILEDPEIKVVVETIGGTDPKKNCAAKSGAGSAGAWRQIQGDSGEYPESFIDCRHACHGGPISV